MKFKTALPYDCRESKARYVFDKYQDILKSSILDVGSDECYLKTMVPDDTRYVGVGMGGSPDIEINLDRETLPFKDGEFSCVLCLDVLEHLDEAHSVFDELCRVSGEYVLISLPNPYYDFLAMLIDHKRAEPGDFKFYGYPDEKPEDRHRWFFSSSEARNFIQSRAEKNGFDVVQIDSEGSEAPSSFKSTIKRLVLTLICSLLTVKASDFYERRTWAVLKKR